MDSNFVNSLGLLFDIAGAVMLFFFGLPPDIRRSGATNFIHLGVDESEKKKAKRFDRIARSGLLLLVAGFVLQLISNFMK